MLTIFRSWRIMCCRLLTVQGSRISRIGSRPCALMMRSLTSELSHRSASCVLLNSIHFSVQAKQGVGT